MPGGWPDGDYDRKLQEIRDKANKAGRFQAAALAEQCRTAHHPGGSKDPTGGDGHPAHRAYVDSAYAAAKHEPPDWDQVIKDLDHDDGGGLAPLGFAPPGGKER